MGIPRKSNPKAQKEFIKHYEQLKNNLNDDEAILFMDAVHPTQNTKVSCGWIKKGVNQAIPRTASRTRFNAVEAINLKDISNSVFNSFDTINQEYIVHFLPKIRNNYSDKQTIHLICDGAGYHKANSVQEMENQLNIKLHFLPPYSPNLNPIERLWKVINEKARNNKYFATKSCFIEAIDTFLYDTAPKITYELCTRITDNFQIMPDIKQV